MCSAICFFEEKSIKLASLFTSFNTGKAEHNTGVPTYCASTGGIPNPSKLDIKINNFDELSILNFSLSDIKSKLKLSHPILIF